MPLDPGVTLTAVGESLCVRPDYGWGWTRLDEGAPALRGEAACGPRPFRMRLVALLPDPINPTGGIGRVEEPGHPCDGHWLVFKDRVGGWHDFTARVSRYNLEIAPEAPPEASWSTRFAAEPWPCLLTGAPHLYGYGVIAATAALAEPLP